VKILKFGGTSVGSAERIREVVAIVGEAARVEPVAVVVSAFAGVTNELLAAARQAAAGDASWSSVCDRVAARHLEAARDLSPSLEYDALAGHLQEILAGLRKRLHGASLLRECTPRALDTIAACGERMSSPIVAAALRQSGLDAETCDAGELIVTDGQFGRARVRADETRQRIRAHFEGRTHLQVVTGFIGATDQGETTTLGRGGSDYTASILGAALDASCIEIWTDVDGVMSADTRLVASAFSLPGLGYDELMELSHFGAKVIYPPTVHPARERGIPLVIRNTMNPAFPGTRIAAEGEADSPSGVRGISSISRVALLRVEGDGMVGVPGIAMRLFGALARQEINVILISQASSEHSICFAVEPEAASAARARLHEEFALERRAGLIDDVTVEDDACLIAAVGAGMRERPGVAGRIFSVLGRHGVNVRAIAQGSSELNITLAAPRADEARAVRAIHDAFFGGAVCTVELFIAGAGRIGGALLAQLASRGAGLLRDEEIDLRVTGLATRRAMVLDSEGIDPAAWRPRLEGAGVRAGDLAALAEAAGGAAGEARIFVDATADPEAGRHYETLLAAGVCVVTANKIPLSGPLARWHTMTAREARGRGARLYHEATVGAGLPVIATLQDLVRTGDRVTCIEGALSGTLGYLMHRVEQGLALSAAVREAHAAGLTEPDPRDDLSGADVGRKALILARVAGFALEPSSVVVEPLDATDEALTRRQRQAAAAGRRLRYLARITQEGAWVGLRDVEASHPAASLSGPDNLIAFTTQRYADSPLVVRGPGAGPEVTAAGLFADILRAAGLAT